MVRRITIGTITKPHGVRGYVKVLPGDGQAEAIMQLVGCSVDIVRGEELPAQHTVLHVIARPAAVLAALDGITTRDEAGGLVGCRICVAEHLAGPLAADEYYVRDLVGLRAVDEQGVQIGCIERVFSTPANDVYVIAPADGHAFMIPAIKDVVRSVDIAQGQVVLRIAEEFYDLRA